MPEPSYSHGGCSVPLIGATIGSHFDVVAQRFASNDCVVSVAQGVRRTYAQMRVETDRFARALVACGVEHAERVGIWSQNNLEWTIVQFATPKVGAILVNINPAYRTRELEYVLRQSGVRTLVTLGRYKTSEYLAMVRHVRPMLPQLERVIVIGDSEPLQAGERSWEELLAGADACSPATLAERQARCEFDDAINIQYTSGTTGFPKGATLTHHNILNNGYFVGEGCRYSDADRICVPVPFYHCFGMVLANVAALTHGATIVIPAPAFNARETLAAVEGERCTSLYGVPTMFIAALAEPSGQYDLSTLRTGIMAGSPCPVEGMRRVQHELHMPEVTICYGMTETSPVSTQTAVDDPLAKRTGTVGRVHPHVEIKVVDANGRIVPRGSPGELCTRGYSVMRGYWNDPAATTAAIDAARYMHTGDIAVMDAAGYINIRGRIKDMVIRGGENIYPREIEEYLYTHPAIADVAVVGVPDERYGEALCAWIVRWPDAALEAPDVIAYCSGEIAHYKVPQHIVFVDEFPLTVSGKIMKYVMREQSIALLGLDLAAGTITA